MRKTWDVLFVLLSSFLIAQTGWGQSWVTHGPNHKVIKALTISPQDTSVMYAGTFGWGVFKTTNAGATWTNSKVGLTNTYVRSIVALSNTTVLCGTNNGVFKSIDGGVNWTLSLTTTVSVRGLVYDNVSGNIYAATFGSGLYKSTNQGTTWTAINVTDPIALQTLSHLQAIALFGKDSLYVGGSISDLTAGGALFRSLDGGTS
jgi:photosystem II stability/assembly factor-like uncharacterized protein